MSIAASHLFSYFWGTLTTRFIFNRIVLWFAKDLGVALNDFIVDDNNRFYLVNGIKQRTHRVKENPDILKYNLSAQEMHKSADTLLQEVIEKGVRDCYQ